MSNEQEFVRFGGTIRRELQQWLVAEQQKRSTVLGRHVNFGEIMAEALVLLREHSAWHDDASERETQERKLAARRAANLEEAKFPCEGCRIQPGVRFSEPDKRWLCDDCMQETALTLKAEEAAL